MCARAWWNHIYHLSQTSSSSKSSFFINKPKRSNGFRAPPSLLLMEASMAVWVHASISSSFSIALFSSMSTVFSIWKNTMHYAAEQKHQFLQTSTEIMEKKGGESTFCNAIRAASLFLSRCIFNSASARLRAETSAALSCASIFALSVQFLKKKQAIIITSIELCQWGKWLAHRWDFKDIFFFLATWRFKLTDSNTHICVLNHLSFYLGTILKTLCKCLNDNGMHKILSLKETNTLIIRWYKPISRCVEFSNALL